MSELVLLAKFIGLVIAPGLLAVLAWMLVKTR